MCISLCPVVFVWLSLSLCVCVCVCVASRVCVSCLVSLFRTYNVCMLLFPSPPLSLSPSLFVRLLFILSWSYQVTYLERSSTLRCGPWPGVEGWDRLGVSSEAGWQAGRMARRYCRPCEVSCPKGKTDTRDTQRERYRNIYIYREREREGERETRGGGEGVMGNLHARLGGEESVGGGDDCGRSSLVNPPGS